MILRIKNLDVAYGDIQVLWDIHIEVGYGEIVAIIGSNGAGKSTLLKTIAGMVKVNRGDMVFEKDSICNISPREVINAGISLIPEGRRLFFGMTVEENLKMGAYTRKDREEISKDLQWVYALFPILEERRGQLSGTLSGGEQQMLAIARGLMSRPKLILIDELSLGLAPVIVDRLLAVIRKINSDGITLLLVEQDVQAALELAHRGYVLETGKIVTEGSAETLLKDERIKKAYLGI